MILVPKKTPIFKWLVIKVKRSRWIGPECITDFDLADDIARISKEIEQAQEMPQGGETTAVSVGLMASPKKTRVMAFSQPKQSEIRTNDGSKVELMDGFTYLGPTTD